jgi:hypothetical protein
MQKTNIKTCALVELQYVTFNEDTVSRMRNPLPIAINLERDALSPSRGSVPTSQDQRLASHIVDMI